MFAFELALAGYITKSFLAVSAMCAASVLLFDAHQMDVIRSELLCQSSWFEGLIVSFATVKPFIAIQDGAHCLWIGKFG
jgi:hypothetical protein